MSLCNVFVCFVLVAVLFALFGLVWFFCVSLFGRVFCFICIVTAYWTMYWSFFSTTFAAHHSTRWSNYNALINGTCCMPIERVDWPGENQEATGGKKTIFKNSEFCKCQLFSTFWHKAHSAHSAHNQFFKSANFANFSYFQPFGIAPIAHIVPTTNFEKLQNLQISVIFNLLA